MLAPKRVKFRKRFKGRTKGMATRGNTLVFGHYALMVLEPGWITNRQIEAGRGGPARGRKRGGKKWARVFSHKTRTQKTPQTRPGEREGEPQSAGGGVEPGPVIFRRERGRRKTVGRGRRGTGGGGGGGGAAQGAHGGRGE